MLEVQKIACVNDTGFDMSFVAACVHGQSIGSATFPIDQSVVIDLGQDQATVLGMPRWGSWGQP